MIREIAGAKTLMGRANHSVSYDSLHDEFTIPNTLGQAILTFRGGANGDEAPIRVLQGPLTTLRNPDILAVDPIHNEIFVDENYAIKVFSREANGNVAPLRVLRGPADAPLNTQGLAVDPVHNLLVVSSRTGQRRSRVSGSERTDRAEDSRLLIFNRTDEGNAAPKAVIGGPKSRYRRPGSTFILYPPKGWIVTSVGSQGRDDGERLAHAEVTSFIGVWSINDNGDVPPKWTVGGPKGAVWQPKAIALDPKNKSLIVSDMGLNAVLTFFFPEMF